MSQYVRKVATKREIRERAARAIQQRYREQGMTYEAIAALYGISLSTVWRVIKKHSLPSMPIARLVLIPPVGKSRPR